MSMLDATVAYLASKMPIRGRKALQKLMYFAEATGVHAGLRFRFHLYGPYSEELTQEYVDLFGKGILSLAADDVTFESGPRTDAVVATYQREIDEVRAKLDRLVERFGQMSPLDLELYATVHFVADSRLFVHRHVEREQVVEDVYALKGKKFSRVQIGVAYDQLVTWEMIPGQAEAAD